MNFRFATIILSFGVLSFAALCLLSTCDSRAPTAGRAQSGVVNLCGNNGGSSLEAINELERPIWRSSVGNAHLEVSTDVEEAQRWFDLGLNYLHGFWHLEAYRAFQMVVDLDPGCAMGYWGIAMCQPGFGGDDLDVWLQAIKRAKSLNGEPKGFEGSLIAALDTTLNQGVSVATAAWQCLIDEHPNQPDALAFGGLMLRQLVRTEVESDKIKEHFEHSLELFPDHTGLLHYYVHTMEVRPDFLDAIAAANHLVEVAPEIPHLAHMPGHLSFLAGRYDEAIKIFEGARTQELAYHKRESIPFATNQNYLHNLHYLAVTYSETGEREKALAAAEAYASVKLRQKPGSDGASWMILYEGLILPALVHCRFGEYSAAAKKISFWLATPVVRLENDLVREYLTTIQYYCYAMDFAVKGDIQRAKGYAEEMTTHLGRFEQQAWAKPKSGELTFAEQAYEVMSMMRYELTGWLNNSDPTQPFYDEDWLMAVQLENSLPYDEPPRLMYPVGESLARLHLTRGEEQAALKAIESALRRRPDSPVINELRKEI